MTAARSTHECPGGCGRPVARQHLACRACWYRLPADLRRPISATYRRDFGAHLAAMSDATDWYRTRRPAMSVPLERFDNDRARVVHGVPAWWTHHHGDCDFDELYVHSHDWRRVLAATSAMIRANRVDYHDIAATETGWCRLVTECGCTTEAHDADHDGGLDCEASGCRFPDLPPCGGLDSPYAWQVDRVRAGAPGAVPFTRVVLS